MVFYAKYNNSRKRQFRLATTIAKTEGGYIVTKKAQSKESRAFLASLEDKYDFLVNQKSEFFMDAPVRVSPEEVSFKYRSGITLERSLLDAFEDRNINDFKSLLLRYEAILKKGTVEGFLSNEFLEVFSGNNNTPVLLQKFGCLDINFDNIIVSGEKLFLIDYEWTFTFPLPYKYIIFRAITAFYYANRSKSLYDFLSLEEVYDIVSLSKTERETYINFEYNFQNYVQNVQSRDINVFRLDYESLSQFTTESATKKTLDSLQDLMRELAISNERLQLSNERLQSSQEEIELMKSSKFWKLRGIVEKIKFGFFHPIKLMLKYKKYLR
jgi:hypothetical protein